MDIEISYFEETKSGLNFKLFDQSLFSHNSKNVVELEENVIELYDRLGVTSADAGIPAYGAMVEFGNVAIIPTLKPNLSFSHNFILISKEKSSYSPIDIVDVLRFPNGDELTRPLTHLLLNPDIRSSKPISYTIKDVSFNSFSNNKRFSLDKSCDLILITNEFCIRETGECEITGYEIEIDCPSGGSSGGGTTTGGAGEGAEGGGGSGGGDNDGNVSVVDPNINLPGVFTPLCLFPSDVTRIQDGAYINLSSFRYDFTHTGTGQTVQLNLSNLCIQVPGGHSNSSIIANIDFAIDLAISYTNTQLNLTYSGGNAPPGYVVNNLFTSLLRAELATAYSWHSTSINTMSGGCPGIPETPTD